MQGEGQRPVILYTYLRLLVQTGVETHQVHSQTNAHVLLHREKNSFAQSGRGV
jgi:hypothetical protein